LIILEHIWKSYGRGRKAEDVLVDIDTTLDFSAGNIGILGARKSGNTTLLEIVAGVTQPDYGRVARQLRVSWPLSWRGAGKDMTGDAQIAFLSRVYQRDRSSVLRYVTELSGLDAKIYQPTVTYTAQEKDRLMFALAMALDFDLYLVDEAPPTIQPEFKPAYDAAWNQAMRGSRQLVTSSKPGYLVMVCAFAVTLDQGRLSAVAPSVQAVASFRQLARKNRTKG